MSQTETDYFLITSYSGGVNADDKLKLIKNQADNIRRYFDKSFVVFVDSHLNSAVLAQDFDIYVFKKLNENSPHGRNDLNQTRLGIGLLKGLEEPEYFYKLNYDYPLNEQCSFALKEWLNKARNDNLDCVSSRWCSRHGGSIPDSMALGFGLFKTKFAQNFFNFCNASYPIEAQLFERLRSTEFCESRPLLFKDIETAFNCDSGFDAINQCGTYVNKNRIS